MIAAAALLLLAPPFYVRVVDQDTGRGVPLVELRSRNEVQWFTDSGVSRSSTNLCSRRDANRTFIYAEQQLRHSFLQAKLPAYGSRDQDSARFLHTYRDDPHTSAMLAPFWQSAVWRSPARSARPTPLRINFSSPPASPPETASHPQLLTY